MRRVIWFPLLLVSTMLAMAVGYLGDHRMREPLPLLVFVGWALSFVAVVLVGKPKP